MGGRFEPRPAEPPAAADDGVGGITLGWAGVRLTVPSHWQVAGIGRDYLLLGEGTHPRLELKSAPVRGAFHLQRHLRRLERGTRGAGVDFRSVPVPRRWAPLVRGLQAAAFAWESVRGAGTGLLLFCPCCRRATLVQFHGSRPEAADGVERVLANLAFHPVAGWNLVALYDIRAEVPESFRLEDFRFAPGHFRLSLADARARLTLQRFAPADVLRQRMDLEALAGAAGLLDGAAAAPCRRLPDVVEWSWTAAGGDGLWARLRRQRPRARRLRLWHVAPANRILAVGLESAAPHAETLFAEVCRRYVPLPQAPAGPEPFP